MTALLIAELVFVLYTWICVTALFVAELVFLLRYLDRSDGSVDRGARVRAFIPRFL